MSCEILDESHHHQTSVSSSIEEGLLDQGHMAQASPRQSLKSTPMCTQPGIYQLLSALGYQTLFGILPPDQTGICIETLLQNYKAELCNKKYTLGFALTPKLSLRES